ncbi:MAG TPA: hypothetical protein VGI45_12500 [Terracidiphilus sp.]|jgi:hypothetical protein
MNPFNRRAFLAGGTAAGLLAGLEFPISRADETQADRASATGNITVDFRFSPSDFQSTICFPDDPSKTVLGKYGDLRCDFPADIFAAIDQFGTVVEFSVAGMGHDTWLEQRMESPGIPIVHTRLQRHGANIELTAFATRRSGEGRVDNVLIEISSESDELIAAPRVQIRSCKNYRLGENTGAVANVYREEMKDPWMICIPQDSSIVTGELSWNKDESSYTLVLGHGQASRNRSIRVLYRFPQGGDGKLDSVAKAEELLSEVRDWWRDWHAFGGTVSWSLPAEKGDFLISCARNIQQAREVKDGMLVFEVGPTVYRGMWIVDGNFLLESARYLGYDDAADKGLLSEWNHQVSTGQIIASAGKEHWKDTAIAMFTLARACELKQDWSLLRQLSPKVGHAIEFLIGLRDDARKGDSPNGKYGLLAPGFPDGGIGGIHFEFTNTLWALAGLRSIALANESLKLAELNRAAGFYQELRAALEKAASDEMVTDERGFRYLPMLMREDPAMHADSWDRPQPQTSQWALSHTIFPGEVFPKDHPIVRGHIALMQACTQEDIPAETGWIHHEGVWNYNAPFVAEVYLWAGLHDLAHRTFAGYLNHASPLHAWREEQPLQKALIGGAWGDMPHNWASAECIRYLRHMLILEDNRKLRLLEGVLAPDLRHRQRYAIQNTPTRFGRISLELEPVATRGWKVHFVRSGEVSPESVELPPSLVRGVAISKLSGASMRKGETGTVLVDPSAREWTAYWEG